MDGASDGASSPLTASSRATKHRARNKKLLEDCIVPDQLHGIQNAIAANCIRFHVELAAVHGHWSLALHGYYLRGIQQPLPCCGFLTVRDAPAGACKWALPSLSLMLGVWTQMDSIPQCWLRAISKKVAVGAAAVLVTRSL